jgi:hypothetical protein
MANPEETLRVCASLTRPRCLRIQHAFVILQAKEGLGSLDSHLVEWSMARDGFRWMGFEKSYGDGS